MCKLFNSHCREVLTPCMWITPRFKMAIYTGQVNNATSRFLGCCVYRRCVKKKVYAVPSHSTCLFVLLKRGPSLTLRGVLSNQIRQIYNLHFRFRASCLVHYYCSTNNKKRKMHQTNER